LRNRTRNEGRSFEVGNQVLISSHRKLLLSKAMGEDRVRRIGVLMLPTENDPAGWRHVVAFEQGL
jgi:hypothetical protein